MDYKELQSQINVILLADGAKVKTINKVNRLFAQCVVPEAGSGGVIPTHLRLNNQNVTAGILRPYKRKAAMKGPQALDRLLVINIQMNPDWQYHWLDVCHTTCDQQALLIRPSHDPMATIRIKQEIIAKGWEWFRTHTTECAVHPLSTLTFGPPADIKHSTGLELYLSPSRRRAPLLVLPSEPEDF